MIEDFISKYKLPAFRLKQFNQAFYQNAIFSFDELTTWSKDLREKLKSEVEFTTLEVDKEFISRNKDTIKVLFNRKIDGQRIESVLMRHKDGRNTVCVSCMVGCPVNCVFCATGKMGFRGNLTSREIIDQVLYFQRYLTSPGSDLSESPSPVGEGRPRVTNIVFMGMGEPLLNLENVENAISVMIDPEKLGISHRKVTLSTSGYITPLKKFIADGFRVRIAISLHAPNQELRENLMPVAKAFKLPELLKTLDEYVELTNKRITYEYILLKGINDRPEHARQLAELFKNRLAHINLIPYNPIYEASFGKPTQDSLRIFTSILAQNNINYTIRVTMGDDVEAACGQLADREEKIRNKKLEVPNKY
jgi:23S rRNA (adenine2503-C2)-methyltransferase